MNARTELTIATAKLVGIAGLLFAAGIFIGVVAKMPERQGEYTPALESLQHYRFPNGRGAFIETRTYSDTSQRFYALPVRHCTEVSADWQQDGEATAPKTWSAVVTLLKQRASLGVPECPKPEGLPSRYETPPPLPNGAHTCRITRDAKGHWWIVGFDVKKKVIGGVGLTEDNISRLRDDLWKRCTVFDRLVNP